MLFRSDRKSTRLNSSHLVISYAVFCLKKKKKITAQQAGVDRVMAVRPTPAREAPPLVIAECERLAGALQCADLAYGTSFFFFFKKAAGPRNLPFPPPHLFPA